jgi:hypothetical protein
MLYKDNLNSFLGLWDRDYTLINRANSALANMDNVKNWSSESEKNRLLGETYFLRAFAYYELVQTFGGVPLRTTTDAINLPRASVDEVYQLIGEDLAKAIELMPNRIYTFGSNMTGHATKAAAQALQARVFLFYTGRYGKTELPNGTTKAKVISDLEDCINNSGHQLVADQRELWGYTNDCANQNAAGYRYGYTVAHDLHWVGNSSIETVFANKHTLTPSLFEACGITPEMRARCVVAGAQDQEEFPNILTGEGGLDYDKVGDEVCGMARELVREHPNIVAILLECTDMPPYAHRIQAELGLPVYDAITLIRYAKTIVTQTPYYGFL